MKTILLRLSFFTIAFFSLSLNETVFAQTIDCTNPSITFDMTAANAARSGAPNPTLTTWPFAKTFSWETYATNAALNANATGIHLTSPNRTNVFYGGNAGTNTHITNINAGDNHSDLINHHIFNLYSVFIF